MQIIEIMLVKNMRIPILFSLLVLVLFFGSEAANSSENSVQCFKEVDRKYVTLDTPIGTSSYPYCACIGYDGTVYSNLNKFPSTTRCTCTNTPQLSYYVQPNQVCPGQTGSGQANLFYYDGTAQASSTTPSTSTSAGNAAGTTAALGILGIFGAWTLGIFLLYGLMFLFIILATIGWILALLDCVKREDWDTPNEKLTWVLVIALTGWIGALLYYFLVKRKKDKQDKNKASNSK